MARGSGRDVWPLWDGNGSLPHLRGSKADVDILPAPPVLLRLT